MAQNALGWSRKEQGGSRKQGGEPLPCAWGVGEHFWPGNPALALGPWAQMSAGRRWGAGSQESSGRCERPGEIDLLGTMKEAKYVCWLSDDSGIPQGSTKCEHQRLKDRPPPTLAASFKEPLLPLDERPTAPHARRAWPLRGRRNPAIPPSLHAPPTLPDLPRMAEEVRHI